MRNPFIVGRPITDSKDFFDRERELEEIFSGIRNQYNISLIGERKIGKTSLLNMVCNPERMQEYSIDPERVLIISIDSSNTEKGNPASVWKYLLFLLCDEVKNDIRKEMSEKITANDVGFSDIVKILSHVEKDVVLILDEFEAICEGMDIDFFQNLRHLAQTSRLTYIVSTSRDLLTLTAKNKRIVSSPFFNIFFPLFLGLFQKDQSKKFIKNNFKEMNIAEEQVTSILRICGPHPFFLQLFCALLFRSLPSDRLDVSSEEGRQYFKEGIRQAEMNFSVSCNNHFEYFWERFDQREKEVLSDIALKGKTNRFETVLKDMERRGFLIKDNGTYIIFSNAFQTWISEHVEKKEEPIPFIMIMAILTFSISLILFFSMLETSISGILPIVFIIVFIIGLFYLLRRGSE
jgi:AAA+ ATPase superfamily predicted ATPase